MPQRAGSFWLVGYIIGRFVELGCSLREAEPTILFEDGDVLNVRYLLNPATGDFVALQDLVDDEHISTEEVQFWERRLRLVVLSDFD